METMTGCGAQEGAVEIADEGAQTEEALLEIARMAAEMAAEKAVEWARTVRLTDRVSLTRSLIEQEDEIRKSEPDFSLQTLMETSEAFCALLMAGESVARALEYVQPERIHRRLEDEVLARVRKRNLRPQGMNEQNRSAEPSAEERLSEEEMRRIDAQLKRGQKVYLK